MKKLLKYSFILAVSLVILSSCQNKQAEESHQSEIKNDDPITYVSFDKKDKNGNYYDEITGEPLYNTNGVKDTTGQKGKAASFNGQNMLELHTFESPQGNQAFTMMCYAKVNTSKVTVTTNNVIMGFGVEKDFSEAILQCHYAKWAAFTYNKTTYADFADDVDTTFYHVALVYDENNMYFYLNYSLKGTIKIRGQMDIYKSPLFIGGFWNNRYMFAGAIDEIYVFNRALEKDEMKEYMEGTKTFNTKDPTNQQPEKTEIVNFSAKDVNPIPGVWNDYQYFADDTTLNFKIYFPDGYTKEKNYPFQLFLHGAMSNGHTVDEVINIHGECTTAKRAIQEYKDTIIMIPVAEASSNWTIISGDTGYPRLTINSIDNQKASRSLNAVMEVINDIEANLNIERNRMYLSGVSAGAMASYYMMYLTPNRWAGTIICCGRGSLDMANTIKDNNIWIFHGEEDTVVDPSCAREMYDALEEAGATTNVKLSMIPNKDHSISTSYLPNEPELINWLYSQTNIRR